MLSFIKRRKVLIIAAVAIILIVIFAVRATAKGDYTAAAPVTGDLVRTVKVSGKVVPQEDASLGFEIVGTIAKKYKDVGDHVTRGSVILELDKSSLLADLASARAELAKVAGGSYYETKTENAKRSIIQAIEDAYTQADDAVHNRVDQVFDNPRSQNPKIIFAFDDIALRDSVNASRPIAEESLSSLRDLVASLSIGTYTDSDLAAAKSYVSQVSRFLADTARAVSLFKSSAALSQTSIDKYRSDIATGRQNVSSAAASLITEGDKLRESVSDVPVQAARVAAAEAHLAKATITSPLTGIVSKQDGKVGETTTAGTALVSVMSETYKIEAYIPEVSIAGVALGNPASVTLDAYGTSATFKATVSAIDPAETIKDGVSTYKVTLAFVSPDERIRSGMTANIAIETKRKPNALLIPERAVVRDGDKAWVYVLVGDTSSEKRDIALGERDSSGNVEVLSGLASSEELLINPPKK